MMQKRYETEVTKLSQNNPFLQRYTLTKSMGFAGNIPWFTTWGYSRMDTSAWFGGMVNAVSSRRCCQGHNDQHPWWVTEGLKLMLSLTAGSMDPWCCWQVVTRGLHSVALYVPGPMEYKMAMYVTVLGATATSTYHHTHTVHVLCYNTSNHGSNCLQEKVQEILVQKCSSQIDSMCMCIWMWIYVVGFVKLSSASSSPCYCQHCL